MLEKLIKLEGKEVTPEVKKMKKTKLGFETKDEEGNVFLITVEDNKVKKVFSLGKAKQVKKMLNKM